MAPHRSFPLAFSTEDGPTFALGEFTFHTIPCLPVTALADMADQERPYAARLVDFVRSVVMPTEMDALDDVLHDKDLIVDFQTLDEVVGWLVRTYTARPTSPSSDSAGGPEATQNGSMDGSDSPASTATN